jgi:hypothetical protein
VRHQVLQVGWQRHGVNGAQGRAERTPVLVEQPHPRSGPGVDEGRQTEREGTELHPQRAARRRQRWDDVRDTVVTQIARDEQARRTERAGGARFQQIASSIVGRDLVHKGRNIIADRQERQCRDGHTIVCG